MKHRIKILLALIVVSPLLAESNPHPQLNQVFTLELKWHWTNEYACLGYGEESY
jgi:hypothetical protein